jgi:predicted enzyme related to lactoylglutathione lyase
VSNARLGFVALRVRDVAASAWFYREAFGVPFESGRSPQPHAEASWKDGADLLLALIPPDPGMTEHAEVGVFVDDFDEAHTRALAAKAQVVREPRHEPCGRSAASRDPDGNLVTLTQRPRALRIAEEFRSPCAVASAAGLGVPGGACSSGLGGSERGRWS